MQQLIDKLKQLIISLQNYMNETTVNPKITIWATAIQGQEGYTPYSRSFKNCNPGNIKFTLYSKSLGATGSDVDNFAIFPSYEVGFHALEQLLVDAASNELIGFHNVDLLQFTERYAEPPNDNYANNVAAALGCTVDTLIKTFLL